MEIRNIPYSDIPQVLEIYAQGVETGRSTFTRTVPSVEEGTIRLRGSVHTKGIF